MLTGNMMVVLIYFEGALIRDMKNHHGDNLFIFPEPSVNLILIHYLILLFKFRRSLPFMGMLFFLSSMMNWTIFSSSGSGI